MESLGVEVLEIVQLDAVRVELESISFREGLKPRKARTGGAGFAKRK
jgi:hypothetical protein